MNRNFDVINFISKYLHLRRPRVANFADIIKIATKKKKLKEFEIICYNLI